MNFTFAIPGDLNTLTGGYVYDKRLLAELRALGLAVAHLELPASFPFATAADIAQTQQLLHAATAPLLIDGLAFGALPAGSTAGSEIGSPDPGDVSAAAATATHTRPERSEVMAVTSGFDES